MRASVAGMAGRLVSVTGYSTRSGDAGACGTEGALQWSAAAQCSTVAGRLCDSGCTAMVHWEGSCHHVWQGNGVGCGALEASPEEVVADVAGPACWVAAGRAGDEAQVVGVPALGSALAHALDEVIADGGGAHLGSGAVVHLLQGQEARSATDAVGKALYWYTRQQRVQRRSNHLALLGDVREVVAEAAQQAPVALVAKVVKADALLLAVEVHDGGDVVRKLALVRARAHALGEVEADLGLGCSCGLITAVT